MQPGIQQVNFKAGLPLEIEVIPIADTLSKHHRSISTPHRASFYNIFWVQQGVAEYLVDFEPVRVKANSFLFVNKDRVKALDHKHKHDGKILLFTDSFFANSQEATRFLHSTILFNDLLETSVIDVSALASLQTLFSEIEKELQQSNDSAHYGIAQTLLYGLLLMAERARRKQGYSEIERGANLDNTILFKDLLEAQHTKLKLVSGYAAQMHISEKRLTAATTKTMGKSPKTMIDERVMLEAKRLLIHTSLSIKEVGYEIGFEDPTYFVRYFRKHTGKTPIEFRSSYLDN
jgi:AraC family transcriptional activator of pobA